MAESGKSWLKYGCFGCLGLVGLVVLLVAGAFGIALLQVRSEQVEEHILTPAVPLAAVAPETEAGEPGTLLPPQEGEGKVVLDLSHAEFDVVPGRPGEPLRVEATYDKKSYVLEETLETLEGLPWTYSVRFRRTAGSGLLNALKQLLGGTQPEVRVVLPVDVPLHLEARTGQGGVRMDIGGLWLKTADLDFSQGGFELRVSEPLRVPLERLTINGSMGGFAVSHLGNASPRRLEVDFSMGGMMLDLRGRWVNDSDISITTSMSGGVVRLPRDVVIEGLDGTPLKASPTDELRPPILRFSTSTSMGELEFQR